jgi:hypothetical protein
MKLQDGDVKTQLPLISEDLDRLIELQPDNPKFYMIRAIYAKDRFQDYFGIIQQFTFFMRNDDFSI